MTMLPRLVEWWEIVLGCIRGRFVSVPGTTLMTPRDIAYRIEAAGISVAITDSENLPKLEAVRDRCPDLREIIVVGDDSAAATMTTRTWSPTLQPTCPIRTTPPTS